MNAALVIFVQRLGLFAASLGIDDRLDVSPMLRTVESARVKNATADAQHEAKVLRAMLNDAAVASRDDASQGAWMYGVCAKKAETWLMTYGDAADPTVKDAIVAVRDAARELAGAAPTPAQAAPRADE